MPGLTISPCDEGVLRGAPDTRGCLERAKRWVLAATILGSSMAFIDGSVVNVALPAMQADLHAGVREAQWILNAYMLMLGALMLPGGALGDRFGRRRVFMLGALVFALASIACGLAPNAATLIAARAAQGVGGAMLTPGSLAIISAAFPKDERGRAIGSWAGASALTTALGPVLGGWLVDVSSWRAIFFINVPIAAIVLVLSWRHVPETRSEPDETGVDWLGAALATIGLGTLAYGLSAAAESGWSNAFVVGSILAGAVVLILFIAHEARASAAMVPLHLFRSKVFSGANVITLLLYFALGGALFFVPFNLIRIQGYTATEAGASFLPATLIMGSLSRWSGGLTEHYGARLPLIVGPIVTAAGYGLFAATGIGGQYWSTFFPAMTVLGFGMAVSVAPLTTTVMDSTEDRFAGAASGINNATARVAGMLAVALLGAVAVGVFRTTLDQKLTQIHASAPLRQALLEQVPKLAEAEVPRQFDPAQRRAGQQALREAFVRSFRVTMLIAAVLALCSSACAALTIPGKKGEGSGHSGPRRNGTCFRKKFSRQAARLARM